MNADNWFEDQSKLAKIIFIIIPFIGWIVEILVRISALIKKRSGLNIAGLVIFVVLGGFWVLCLIDVIAIVASDRLILME